MDFLLKLCFSDKLELTDEGAELFSKVTGEETEEIDVDQLNKLLRHIKSRKTKKFDAKCDYDTKESLVDRVVWHGGSESATFNRLEVNIFLAPTGAQGVTMSVCLSGTHLSRALNLSLSDPDLILMLS